MAFAVLLIAGLFFIPHGQPDDFDGGCERERACRSGLRIGGPGGAGSGVGGCHCLGAAADLGDAAPSGQPAVVDLTAMDQPARKAFLLRLIDQGVFTGVQAPPAPKVGVTPLFQGLSADLKQQFIAVVDAYVYNGATGPDPLQVIDDTSGKVVGTYTPGDGLKLE